MKGNMRKSQEETLREMKGITIGSLLTFTLSQRRSSMKWRSQILKDTALGYERDRRDQRVLGRYLHYVHERSSKRKRKEKETSDESKGVIG